MSGTAREDKDVDVKIEGGIDGDVLESLLKLYGNEYASRRKGDEEEVQQKLVDRYFLPAADENSNKQPAKKLDTPSTRTVPTSAETASHQAMNDTNWFIRESLLASISEPLEDAVTDPNQVGCSLLETHFSRYLSIFGSHVSSQLQTTANDLHAVLSLAPGQNFVRAGKKMEKLKLDEAKGGSGTGVAERRAKNLEQQDKEAAEGSAKRKNQRTNISKFSDKAKRIITLPAATLFPESPCKPETYTHRVSQKEGRLLLFDRSNPKTKPKGKYTTQVYPQISFKLPVDEEHDLKVYGSLCHRLCSYLLVVEEYEWEDEEWRSIVHYLMKEGRPKDLIIPEDTIKDAELDFSVYSDVPRERLLASTTIPGYSWSRSARDNQVLLLDSANNWKPVISKSMPSTLTIEQSKVFEAEFKGVFAFLVNDKKWPISKPTASNAFDFVVRNPTGQLTGWIEHLPMVNITCNYGAILCNAGAEKANVELVDPTKHAAKDIRKYGFEFQLLGSKYRINATDYEGVEVPKDIPDLPSAWTVAFPPEYMDRLKGKADSEMVDGRSVSDHCMLQKWIRCLVCALTKADLRQQAGFHIGLLRKFREMMGIAPGRYKRLRKDRPFAIKQQGNYLHLCLRTNFDYGSNINNFMGSRALYKTGIRIRADLVAVGSNADAIAQHLCDYANDVYVDIKSIIGAVDCVAFIVDVYAAEHWKRPCDVLDGLCNHTKKDQKHDCPNCHGEVGCVDLIPIAYEVYCTECLEVPQRELIQKAKELSEVYPELMRLLSASWSRDYGDKQTFESKRLGPVHVDDLSVMVQDVFECYRGAKAKDFVVSTLDLQSSANPLLSPSLLHKLLISIADDVGSEEGKRSQKGTMVRGNVTFTTLASTLLKYTHSSATLKTLWKSIANRRDLSLEELKAELSCLVPYDKNGKPDLSNVPACISEKGKLLRAFWRELNMNASHERKFPHIKKDRYDMKKLALEVARECGNALRASESRVDGYKDGDSAIQGTESAGLTRIDDNLRRSVISNFRPVVKGRSNPNPVPREVVERLTRIVIEMQQDLSSGTRCLPRGRDGFFSFLTGDNNLDWTADKARRFCQSRLRRMLLVCNWKHAADPCANWTTLYLTLCWWVLRLEGVCEITGQPFMGEDRHPNRISIGHWIHNRMMTVGWVSAVPQSLADFVESLCNIKAETWPANAMKSNFSHDHCEAALTVHTGKVARSSVSLPSALYSSFFPNEPRWLGALQSATGEEFEGKQMGTNDGPPPAPALSVAPVSLKKTSKKTKVVSDGDSEVEFVGASKGKPVKKRKVGNHGSDEEVQFVGSAKGKGRAS